jgi:uncharacterized protein YggU (UPF0235/DUF167 family)
VRINVKAKPGSRRGDLVTEMPDGSFEVHLKEKPVDGKANEALIRVLAKHFGIKQRDVSILTGASARLKIVEIEKPA